MPEEPPPFPNRLREVREQQRMITREALRAMCGRLYDEDALLYSRVSLPGLRNLELGLVRPRARTATTLARALEREVLELFPAGLDDPRRNPCGNTRISPERKKGGRPRKSA